MRRLFFWIVLLPLAIVLVVFAVSNRVAVTLDLWPLPFQVDLPLYLALLGAVIVGVAAGGMIVSITGAARRARRARREKEKLKSPAAHHPAPGTAIGSADRSPPSLPGGVS